VYFLAEKSEAIEAFKRFKARVEKEILKDIQCLRTDRGGEYTSNEFANMCESNGIKRQLTAAYTPHQNGVSERKKNHYEYGAKSASKQEHAKDFLA
jgi:transposase InsO family protein